MNKEKHQPKPNNPSQRKNNTKKYWEIRTSQNKHTLKSELRSRDLENFSSVKKLADHLFDFEYGSRVCLDDYIGGLCKFCNFVGMTPDEIILLDHGRIEKSLNDLCESMAKQNLSLGYARKIVYNVKTFLRCNGINLNFKPPKMPPRYRKRERYVPTPKEAKKMMDNAGSLKNAALVGLLAFGGLRNSTLRALRYGICPDPRFPEYSIKDQLKRGEKVLTIIVHPNMKRIVKSACKGKIPYFTFLPEFVTEKLRVYLNNERAKRGKIEDQAFLFPTNYRRIPAEKSPFTPLARESIDYLVKQAARNAGLPQWKFVAPQSLRIAFKMWLINQPEAVRLPYEDREFIMGHIPPGTIAQYYEARPEELKQKFSKLVLSESDYNRSIFQAMCTMLGIDFNVEYSELREKLGREPSITEVGEIVKRKLRPKQKIVAIEDVPKHLDEGWRWVGKYDDKNGIVEK
jgi:hypothetical protein